MLLSSSDVAQVGPNGRRLGLRNLPHSFHQSLTGKMELSPTGLRNQSGSASAYTSRCPELIAWPAWGRVPHPAPLSAQDV